MDNFFQSSMTHLLLVAASNEFFFSFPNCLVYETLDGCVDRLQYALEHKPEPLSHEHRRALSWEGATERLYKASGITQAQEEERIQKGIPQQQRKAAQTHVDMARKSHFVTEMFSGRALKKLGSSASDGSSSATTPSADVDQAGPKPCQDFCDKKAKNKAATDKKAPPVTESKDKQKAE